MDHIDVQLSVQATEQGLPIASNRLLVDSYIIPSDDEHNILIIDKA